MRGFEFSSRSPLKIALIVANVLLIAGLGGFGGYYFWKYRQVMNNPAKYIDFKKYELTPEQENQQLLDKIGKLISLPTGETPIVSTIKDVEALKKDPFFANAINGDRLIIYQAAKQAVLYRESENKIIKAGPVVLPDSAKKKVAILGTEGDVATFETAITKAVGADIVVSAKSTPAVANEAPIVVDTTGANAQLAQKIATEINGTVASGLPEGQTKPANSDIVVIGTYSQ